MQTKDNVEYQKRNAITGESIYLYRQIERSMEKAEAIDIIVSFLMESGVKLLLKDIKKALTRGAKVRILTGNYMNITQPSALYLLKRELGNQIEMRFYNNPRKSFHPKAYIFHSSMHSEIFIGSSNLSRGALTSSIEWNYRLEKKKNEIDFMVFVEEFNRLFQEQAYEITDEVLKEYSVNWKRPKVYADFEKQEQEENIEETVQELEEEEATEYEEFLPTVHPYEEHQGVKKYEPTGAQIEALYSLEQTRQEGFEKGLVVAATGIGKTYLAAFDSKKYKSILFVAHRIEILQQAAKSFQNIRAGEQMGFFYGETKEQGKQVVFALVQTLGKKEYLQETYFAPDQFEYVIVDEFHHAAAENYQNILAYFKPKFLLGLTATPERMDAKNVFELCDYNVVYEVRIKEAIEKGWLVPFRYYGIFDYTVEYDRVTFSGGRYNERELEAALMLNKRSDLIYKHYRKYKTERALGFCSSKLHAEYMAEAFVAQGIRACAVYSGEQGTYSKDRETAIRELTSGELQIIFSVDMFNEGLDIPSIDMVLFLRPTQSPTVFLQQLGRGLRKYLGKSYVNVLDFIGNYRKANYIPFFLSGEEYSSAAAYNNSLASYAFPEDCMVDFDFNLIDLFKEQAKYGRTKEEYIRDGFLTVCEEMGHIPSRMELLSHLEGEVYEICRSNKKLNPFRDYLGYLIKEEKATEEEKELAGTFAGEFIKMIESTSMSKSYKMPLLFAFYNGGAFKLEVSEEDIYESFSRFYHNRSNAEDLLKDKATQGYKTWAKDKYVKLAVNNPVKAMKQTHKEFFYEKEGCVLAIKDALGEWIENTVFLEHVKDAIDSRVMEYYRNRYERKE